MAEPRAGMLMVLPRWGGGRGGIYSTAHSLIHQLRNEGQTVYCLTGCSQDEISEPEKEHIKQLGVDVLEIDLEDEEEPKSPEERVKDGYNFDVIFSNAVPILRKVKYIISYSDLTSELAKHLLNKPEASGCELLVFNNQIERSQEAVIEFAELARSAKAVFSVSPRAKRCLNSDANMLPDDATISNQLLVLDYSNALIPGKHRGLAKDGQNRIFVPLWNTADTRILECLICAVNCCNETLRKTGQVDQFSNITMQVEGDVTKKSQYFQTCNYKDHVHQNYNCVAYSSVQEITNVAGQSSLVIASGNYTETGFAGMEFLMNGMITLVPEDSDLAEVLMQASPVLARSFLLPKMSGMTSDQTQSALKEWERIIHFTMREKDKVKKNVSDLVNELKEHSSYKEGQRYLYEAFTVKVKEETSVTFASETQSTKGTSRGLPMGPANINLTDHKLLGKGTVGLVYEWDPQTAVKVIPTGKQSFNVDIAAKEIRVMAQLYRVERR